MLYSGSVLEPSTWDWDFPGLSLTSDGVVECLSIGAIDLKLRFPWFEPHQSLCCTVAQYLIHWLEIEVSLVWALPVMVLYSGSVLQPSTWDFPGLSLTSHCIVQWLSIRAIDLKLRFPWFESHQSLCCTGAQYYSHQLEIEITLVWASPVMVLFSGSVLEPSTWDWDYPGLSLTSHGVVQWLSIRAIDLKLRASPIIVLYSGSVLEPSTWDWDFPGLSLTSNCFVSISKTFIPHCFVLVTILGNVLKWLKICWLWHKESA